MQMKITESNVKKIYIDGIKNHDAINVFIENFSPGRGQITIACYNEAWVSFWGGLGDMTMEVFFVSCDVHYLAKKLAPRLRSMINDHGDTANERAMIRNPEHEDLCEIITHVQKALLATWMQSVAEKKGVAVSEIFRRAEEAYVASQNRIGGLIERY